MFGRTQANDTDSCLVPDMDGNVLLERSRNGDMVAFEELFRLNHSIIVGAIRRILRNSPDVEDVAHEVFLKAFRAIHKFKGQSKLSSWLYPIALRASIDHLRKSRPGLYESFDAANAKEVSSMERQQRGRTKRNGDDDHYSAYRASENEKAYLEEHVGILDQLLKASDPKHAEVIELCHIQGHHADEAAKIAGLKSASEVYEITKHYARRCLKAKRELDQTRVQSRVADKSR
jgi:RNA polymerase sigma factor (sigma-70 family)